MNTNTHERPMRQMISIWIVCCLTLYPLTSTADWRFVGVPFANFTADKGLGYGVFGSAFSRQPETTTRPYDLAFEGQFYQTTQNYAFHKLKIDYPTERYRLNLNSGWENWENAPYYGSGARSIRDLSRPIEYYHIGLSSLWIQPQLRHNLWSELEGIVLITLRDVTVQKRANLLKDMQPKGAEGGRFLMYALGLTIDTRNQEPTPTAGYWIEASVGLADETLGSEFNTQSANLTHRQWWALDDRARFVLASRTMIDIQRNAPFFQHSTFGGSQLVETGGHSLLRGLDTGRVRGERKGAQTFEFHVRLSELKLFSKRIAPIFVAFSELAHISEHSDSIWSSAHLLGCIGLGARAVVDNAFVARFDFGLTPERVRTQSGQARWENRMGGYVIVGHSF